MRVAVLQYSRDGQEWVDIGPRANADVAEAWSSHYPDNSFEWVRVERGWWRIFVREEGRLDAADVPTARDEK